jgi:hypothetical protein
MCHPEEDTKMKSHRAIFLVVAVLALSALACQVSFGDFGIRSVRGSGDLVEESRVVNDFTQVEFAAVGNLKIDFGSRPALTIEAEDNLVPLFITEVRGETLHIELKNGTTIVPTESINISLTVVDLERLSVSGAGDVDLAETKSGSFRLSISGAGNVDVAGLEAERLNVGISGAGDLRIDQGQVEDQEISISGAGNYAARDLKSDRTEIQLSGLGSATVWATEVLDVSISGAGSVRYAGDPSVDMNISGIGSVNRIGSEE